MIARGIPVCLVLLSTVTTTSTAFVLPLQSSSPYASTASSTTHSSHLFQAYYNETSPSDYGQEDLVDEKHVEVDENEEDVLIRDALKRELLLLSSVTNRGEYTSQDEQNMIIDLVAQLEALNPTADPAKNSQGEWDLCLSSTQFFRSSPFFQSIRTAMGPDNKRMALNFFAIHDRSTTAGRVGRVRQRLTDSELVSEVDIELGLLPGIPVRVKGTVVTTASLKVVNAETFETMLQSTTVKGSNIPLLNEFLDDIQLDLPWQAVLGSTPTVTNKIFYLDEAMRIVRDEDSNFFVFTRA